jgi:hypothetical protein
MKKIFNNHSQIQMTKIKSVSAFYVKHAIAFCLLYLSITQMTNAQLRLMPLQQKQSTTVNAGSSLTRTLSEDDTLGLPFKDDFTLLPTDGNGVPLALADPNKWKNSRTVWVNNGMGINPPSVNVATFDGLDSLYQPYETSQILVNGFTDKLESLPIDLSLDWVALNERNSVYLSFFYQWEGNGEAPDPTDYLQLEFLNKDTVWEQIDRFVPGDTPDNTVFHYVNEKVDTVGKNKFFHKGFQFRIRRYGRKSGPFDTWNVDYVYLDKGRTAGGPDFQDIAISTEISPLFNPYRSVPLKHFFATKFIDNVTFVASNLNKSSVSGNYYPSAIYTDYYENTTSKNTEALGPKADISLIPSSSHKVGQLAVLPSVDNTFYFDSLANSIKIQLVIKMVEDSNNAFITTNDSISSTYTLADYYAYDDGIADNSVILTQPGNAAALQFTTIVNRPDMLLKGFDIYFPAYGVENNQTVDLTIYNDIDGKPGNVIATRRGYTIQRKELNEFSRIVISPIEVTDVFYIGWTEPASGKIKVGLDYSNDTGDKIFVKIGSTWSQNTEVQGSLMIRPFFGAGELVTGVTDEKEVLAYYPNPNDGTFYIQGKYDHLQIINVTGQLIPHQSEDAGETKKITMQSIPGLYFIQIRKGKTEKTGKLIIK